MPELSWMDQGLSIGGRLARRALAALLPQDCLLCAQPAAGDLLCAPCRASLPFLPAGGCPVCALPTPDGATCGGCLHQPPHFDATSAPLVYGFPLDRLIQALKYSHRLSIADLLARAMLDHGVPDGDLLLPVPLSAVRLRERGFNQAAEIARPLARRLGLPLVVDAVLRIGDTVPQASLPWKERRKNIRRAFECRTDLTGRRVIVVDDVMTTGATLDELARILKAHGASRVTNWVAARTLKSGSA